MIHTSETFKDSPPSHGAETPRAGALFLIFEGERLDAGGARFSLSRTDEVLLGRGAARAVGRTVSGGARRLTVRVPDRRVSAAHVSLTRAGDRWLAEDAGSTNGSRLNGRPLERAVLEDGDLLELGWTWFRFRESLATPEGSAIDVDAAELDRAAPGLATLHPEHARALADLSRVARSDVPILLLGETGTGKEVLARAVHTVSARSGELVAINCAALPDTLVESQLFGHVRGAFSGAVRDEPGLVRASDGGTLFLDEIGDLPMRAQATLLRVLQEREVTPVGAARAIKVDLRVVGATNRPLDVMVARGGFRSDLYARLSGFVHLLPPLRERLEDAGVLVAELLGSRAGDRGLTLHPDAARAIFQHPWPLNVRELAQCLSLAIVLARAGTIEGAHLPPPLARVACAPQGAPSARVVDPSVEEDARLRVDLTRELASHAGNVTEVARALGKARTQVHRWLKRLDIDAGAFRR